MGDSRGNSNKFERKGLTRRPKSKNYNATDSSSSDVDVEDSSKEILGPLIKEFKKLMVEGKGSPPVNAYIICNYDAHMSEYLTASDQRLMFLTGFTGSVGTAIILRDTAAFWTDPRFIVQATDELEDGWIVYRIGDPEAVSEVDFLKNNLNPGDTVAADAKLMPYPIWLSLKRDLKRHEIRLVHSPTNLVDALWGDAKPKPVVNPIQPLGQEYAGRTIASKLEEIRSKMEEKSVDILLLTQLDDIAWMLNLRGTDVPYCPVFLAFMVISMTTVDIFTDKRRLQYKSGLQLLQEGVDIRFSGYERVYEFLKYIKDYSLISKIWVGPTASFFIYNMIPETKRFLEQNPVELLKCIKNPVEAKGMEQAHIKDGVAMVQFLCWLEDEHLRRVNPQGKPGKHCLPRNCSITRGALSHCWLALGKPYKSACELSTRYELLEQSQLLLLVAPGFTDYLNREESRACMACQASTSGGVTEIEAAEKLDSIREMEYAYMGRSFPTVSASGPHSAIPHYVPTPPSSQIIGKDEIYLIDSGAQYIDGTTDISRTLFYSEPTDFMVDCYTRVFKGLVAVSTQVFPKGTLGRALDTLARKHLWDVGLNYKHGSGHGIGCFLYAHETPVGIAWKSFPEEVGLQPNMFLTIEPGVYTEDEFGVRIENVVRTVEAETKYNYGERFLTFETVTLCPIMTKLLDVNGLTEQELKFLNNYHAKVKETLMPGLLERRMTVEIEWLNNNTKRFPEDKAENEEEEGKKKEE